MGQYLHDYSSFIEVVEQEEYGAYKSWSADLHQYIETELGVHQQNGFYHLGSLAANQISNYHIDRLDQFGPTEYYKTCKYCNGSLKTVASNNSNISSEFGTISLNTCIICGWWETGATFKLETDPASDWYRSREIRRRAVLKKFRISGSELPLTLLKEHLTKDPDLLTRISPKKLEELTGDIFSEHLDCEAIHLGGPNDGGVDIILINGEQQYAIQVKRRSNYRSESVKNIREFLGAMLLKKYRKGFFVSSAPKFSQASYNASNLAQELELVDYIELVDSKKLMDICKLNNDGGERNWEAFMEFDPENLEYSSRLLTMHPVSPANRNYLDALYLKMLLEKSNKHRKWLKEVETAINEEFGAEKSEEDREMLLIEAAYYKGMEVFKDELQIRSE